MATIKNVVTIAASRTIARRVSKMTGARVVDNGSQAGDKRWSVVGDKVVHLQPHISAKGFDRLHDGIEIIQRELGGVVVMTRRSAISLEAAELRRA